MAENAASALPQSRPVRRSPLGDRILSALVLMPVAITAIWLGGPWVVLLAAAAAGVMTWEWGRLVGHVVSPTDGFKFACTGAGLVIAAGFVSVALGCAFTLVMIVLDPRILWRGTPSTRVWAAAGLVWIVWPTIGFVWLRNGLPSGLAVVAWIAALVWSIDVAAYVVGRSVGGPRLAPRVSPNKTWSGLLGGILAAAIVGLVMAPYLELSRVSLALAGILLALVEQGGDMAESYAKRRFGCKDSGTLIPGHGGALDRLDGMLAVIAVVAAFVMLRQTIAG